MCPQHLMSWELCQGGPGCSHCMDKEQDMAFLVSFKMWHFNNSLGRCKGPNIATATSQAGVTLQHERLKQCDRLKKMH